MTKCTAITRGGNRCKGIAIDESGYCYAHHPKHAEARRRAAHKGGKRGGRGRPSTELSRLQARVEELAEKVLEGEVERGAGAVAGQLFNIARACVKDSLAARDQEELADRLDALEDALEAANRRSGRLGG
jgi:hypothetical protein